jgi:tetratricopeptide (TPR) repeat protein
MTIRPDFAARQRTWKPVCAVLSLLLGSSILAAQSHNGSISVAVRDSSGKPIAEASLSLLSPQGTVVATAKTDPEGKALFPGVPPGSVTLRAEKSGFTPASQSISLSASNSKQVDLVLLTAAQPLGPPEFADEPSFTVAGVSDATNLGGHGSNAVLHTKETLVKETVSLGGKSSAQVSPGQEQALREKLRQAPLDFAANLQLALLLLEQGKPGEALVYSERASATSPSNADAHHLLARVKEDLGKPLDAVGEYQRAAELDPSESNLFDWGAELLLHHAPEPAVEVFTRGHRRFPDSSRMLAALGAGWYAQGSLEKAIECLAQASDLDPNDLHPYLLLGELQGSGSASSGLLAEKLERFARLHAENSQANYYYAVSLWNRRNSPPDAGSVDRVMGLLQKAVRLDPRFGEAFLELGNVYSEQGDLPAALSAYEKAATVSPELPEAHYRLAQAYRRAGKGVEARKELNVFSELSKKNSEESERRRHEVQQFVYTLRDKKTQP